MNFRLKEDATEMQKIQMAKIEELTLHMIAMENRPRELEEENVRS